MCKGVLAICCNIGVVGTCGIYYVCYDHLLKGIWLPFAILALTRKAQASRAHEEILKVDVYITLAN